MDKLRSTAERFGEEVAPGFVSDQEAEKRNNRLQRFFLPESDKMLSEMDKVQGEGGWRGSSHEQVDGSLKKM